MKQSSQQPETMTDFFDVRSASYDAHMQRSVADFDAFYAAVAQSIPHTQAALRILDIGCGTGLELDPIWQRAPNARVTGVDLSARMLAQLRDKYADRREQLALIQGSYLDVPFGEAVYDWAVSVMTLHHILPESKQRLYGKLRRALKPGGCYVEGDYVVSPEQEAQLLARYRERLPPADAGEEGLHHVDIPLTLAHQRELLLAAGFTRVEVIWQQEQAAVYVAET